LMILFDPFMIVPPFIYYDHYIKLFFIVLY
jgi:hypothetical protein